MTKSINQLTNQPTVMPIHPLVNELQKLSESSKHAVAQGNSYSLDRFREYLHIEREVEKELKERIKFCAKTPKAQLLLVCGNVGDGKSHILSYLNKELKDEISKFKIHNDATEAHNPDERSNQTLYKLLEEFQDEKINKCNDKIILAINLGTLNNFLDEYSENYTYLKEYVNEHYILDSDVINENKIDEGHFQHVNFTDYHMYSLTNDGPKSIIISTFLDKIVSNTEENPIYKAYKKTKELELNNCPICLNYEFLFDENNRNTITDLLIQAIIKNKLIISVRALLNFFYDLIVPIYFNSENLRTYKKQLASLKANNLLNSLIPNYIFEHPQLSTVFRKVSNLDPCSLRYAELDLELIRLINSDDPEKIFKDFIGNTSLEIITDHLPVLVTEKLGSKIKNDALTKSFIRLNYFKNRIDVMTKSDPYYLEYMITLHHFNNHQMDALEKIYALVQDAARRWYGDPNKTDMVVLHVGNKQSKYRVFKSFKAEPFINLVEEFNLDVLTKFVQEFSLKFKVDGEAEPARMHVDYGLYKILNQIITGYLPNRKDSNNYLSFVSLINRLINQDCEKVELEIDAVNIGEASDFKLSKDAFGHYKFQSL